MRDVLDEIAAAVRTVARRPGDEGELVAVRVQRSYRAPVADVWDAVTDPGRLGRWFGAVSGDLRPGGRFAVDGNAEGEIRRCEPPARLTVTWGAPSSVVEVRLTPDGEDRTLLALEHTVPVELAGSGAGALYVGPGWDVAVLALALHLDGGLPTDPATWEGSAEVRRCTQASIEAWAAAVTASGTASAEELAAATEAARAQFAPQG